MLWSIWSPLVCEGVQVNISSIIIQYLSTRWDMHTCRLAGVTELQSISVWSCRRQKFETPIDFVRPSFWHSIMPCHQNTPNNFTISTLCCNLSTAVVNSYVIKNRTVDLPHWKLKPKDRYTLATKTTVAETRDKSATKSTVTDTVDFVADTVNFVTGFGNKSAITWIWQLVDHVQFNFVTSVYRA